MKKGKVSFNSLCLGAVLLLIICVPVITGGEDIAQDLFRQRISNIEMSEIPENGLLFENQNPNNNHIDLFEMGWLYAQIFEPYRYLFIADYEVGEDEIKVTDLILNPENFLLVQDPADPNDPVVKYWIDLGADPNLFGQNDPGMAEVFGRDSFVVDLTLPIFADPNLRLGCSAIEKIIQAGPLEWNSTVGGYSSCIQVFLLRPLPVYPYDGMPTYLPAKYAAIEAISVLDKPYFNPVLVFQLEGALWNANVMFWPNIAALDYAPRCFEDIIVTIEATDGISSDAITFPINTLNYPVRNNPPALQLDIEDQICYVDEICEYHVNFIDPDCFIFSISPVPTTTHVPGFPISSDFRTDMDELFWSIRLTNVPPDQYGPWVENIIDPVSGLISFNPPYEGAYDAIITCSDGQGAKGEAELTFFCITCLDTDGDGYTTCAGDCDDADPNISPSAQEICDGKDNDCNGVVDDPNVLTYADYYLDSDNDGYGDPHNSWDYCKQPAEYVTNDQDCDDNDPNTNPGATEICDGKDNDCDEQIDEEVCNIYYKDEDNDGQGVDGDSQCLCSPDELNNYTATYSGDPDDSDPNIQGAILNLPVGWSMISLSVAPLDARLSEVFPGAAVMYSFERGAGYVRVHPNQELQVGTGYWILVYYEAQNYVLTGQPITSYSKTVYSDGWAMIGGCTSDAKASGDNCYIKIIYGYEQGSGYIRVQEGENLIPGKGYWILLEDVMEQAKLTMKIIDPNYNSLKQGTITVIKHVVNDNGGNAQASDFTISLNDDNNTSFPGEESPGATFTFITGYSYNVTETGPDSYIATFSGDCSGVIEAEVDKVCTIINDDKAHLKPGDADLPLVICEDSVYDQDGNYNCHTGLMTNSGNYLASNDTARWTNFRYEETNGCQENVGVSNNELIDLIDCDNDVGGNPDTIYFGEGLPTNNGEMMALRLIEECFQNISGTDQEAGIYNMWQVTLPVTQCTSNPGCAIILGTVSVYIAWVNYNQPESYYTPVPKFMYAPTDEYGDYIRDEDGDPLFVNWPGDTIGEYNHVEDVWTTADGDLIQFMLDLYNYYVSTNRGDYINIGDEIEAAYGEGWQTDPTIVESFFIQGADDSRFLGSSDPNSPYYVDEEDIDAKVRWASFIYHFSFQNIVEDEFGNKAMRPAPWKGNAIYFRPGCNIYVP
jgi:hypothetical protein